MEKILILDNYDSFTYNIVHLLHELGTEVDIARNDRISVEEAGRYNRIILSPGPGIPSEAGILPEVVKRYAAEKSILGICLGEQAIGECFGAELENLPEVFHGICTPVRVIAEEKSSFLEAGLRVRNLCMGQRTRTTVPVPPATSPLPGIIDTGMWMS